MGPWGVDNSPSRVGKHELVLGPACSGLLRVEACRLGPDLRPQGHGSGLLRSGPLWEYAFGGPLPESQEVHFEELPASQRTSGGVGSKVRVGESLKSTTEPSE